MWLRTYEPERQRCCTVQGYCFGWLTLGEPVRMNRMRTSITLWEIPENPIQGVDDGGLVPGCVMFGLNLAKLWIIVDTPESMTRQVAHEVHTGTLQNGTSLQI